MSRSFEFASLLLVSSALVSPSAAFAQGAGTTPAPAAPQATDPSAAPAATPDAAAPQETPPEVSVPGGPDIVVRGRRSPRDLSRTSTQSLSVLSTEDIARTGEGDIAGALARVTGLSVVGNGFVYVRGLGDRYSLALLNGSPLPSPEPLRRVVPLDIFPTNVIASSLVQKSYSANFPGEFGGGVINLTTKSVPKKGFFDIDAGIGIDTVTTGQLGYTYFGTSSDWTGFGNGGRIERPRLASYWASGRVLGSLTNAERQNILAQLITPRNSVVQRNGGLPPNWSVGLSGGKSWDVQGGTLGVIATFGYSNKWRTRDTTQQALASATIPADPAQNFYASNYRRVITDNRIVVDGLIGASYDWDRNKIRWTTLYIRDTIKQARLGLGTEQAQTGAREFLDQNTAWFERQLIDTQLVAELRFSDSLSLDLRGGYANSRRNAPEEINFTYTRVAGDGYQGLFTNALSGGATGSAEIRYSFLRENLYSAGADLTWKPFSNVSLTAGYAFSDTYRRTEVRDYQIRANFIPSVAGTSVLRPDLLVSPTLVTADQFLPAAQFGYTLQDNNPNYPVFGSSLTIHAGYLRGQWDPVSALNIDVGVRFEGASQRVASINVFTNAPVPPFDATTVIQRTYALPALALTYKITPELQARISGSKTIARPQFRELVFQRYYDPEVNRLYAGNPLLTDSQLYNAEARLEWYFARDQRLAVGGFYKYIDSPIETFLSLEGDNLVVGGFANAPAADLYGVEVETQKYFKLDKLFGDSGFFNTRRAVVIANYTYTQSSLKVRATDPARVFTRSAALRATDLFQNGAPLTGQSDHLVNLELGLEDTSRLSQQTFLLSYASRRVTGRRPFVGQPDIYEYPGFRLDFVARQGVKLFGINTEMKVEARNITGTRYQEYQANGANRVFYNLYNQGTLINFSLGVNF